MRALVGGCFNTIHLGHVYCLSLAKSQSDELWVVLANDENNLKKTALPAQERLKNLARLGIADRIIVGDPHDFTRSISEVRPEKIFLGHDQRLSDNVVAFLKKDGIALERLPKLPGYMKGKKRVVGKVVSGMGAGSRFMSIDAYSRKMRDSTGQQFYAGTLNIAVCRKNIDDLLDKKKLATIGGFTEGGREFGPVAMYPAVFAMPGFEKSLLKLPLSEFQKTEDVWVVMPQYSRHSPHIVELVHKLRLREVYDLSDGRIVELSF